MSVAFPDQLDCIAGTDGTLPEHVDTLLIPGRFRDETGMGLSPESNARVAYAAEFFHRYNLLGRGGLIVCSGYKNPADQDAEPWCAPNGTKYIGRPEAFSMQAALLDAGVHGDCITVEPDSVDTVTNFVYSREHIPEGSTVGIVAQEQHLDRMMKYIAPRVLRNDYVGLIVPEIDPEHPDRDGLLGALFSRAALLGLQADSPNLQQKAEARVDRMWSLLQAPQRLRSLGRTANQNQAAA